MSTSLSVLLGTALEAVQSIPPPMRSPRQRGSCPWTNARLAGEPSKCFCAAEQLSSPEVCARARLRRCAMRNVDVRYPSTSTFPILMNSRPVKPIPRTYCGVVGAGDPGEDTGSSSSAPNGQVHPSPSLPSQQAESSSEAQGSGNGARPRGSVALLLEVEGVMVDIHKVGHLEAHNSAFLACGFDWARWSTATYNGLHRRTGGDPSAMLRIFFEDVRWPIDGMDRDAKDALILRLVRLKNDALRSAVEAGTVPLRPGLVEILEEALGAGCHVAAIAGQARCGEDTARKILRGLPGFLQERVLVVGKEEVEGSLFWQVVRGQGNGTSVESEDSLASQLTQAVVARKQEVAEQVAKVLKVRVDVDTGAVGSQGAEGVAALRAACELMQVPLAQVVVFAGSQGMVQVATRAGLPSIAIRSSITAQAEFPGSLQVYEDFGPGSLTVNRLLRRLGFS